MMPLTDFLSCTDPIDQFESLSYHQRRHAKAYVTGLIASRNKTIEGIANHVLPSRGERALNNFLSEYDWDESRLNHERLELLQKHGDNRWKQDGYVVLDDSLTEKTGEDIPGVGTFFDHADGDYVWGQDLVYSFYTDEKTGYPLAFRLYEKGEETETKIELAQAIVGELEEEMGVSAETYLFDSWYTAADLVETIEAHGKDWIGPVRSNRLVEFANEELRVDELHEQVDLTEREIDDVTYHIWTRKLPISQLGERRLIIAEKVTDDGENPVKYLVTNKIDAPTEHIIRSFSMRWRIETFFEDSKQDLGFGDCEVQRERGAERHWHLLMLAYSLLRLGSESSALTRIRSKATSLQNDLKQSLREAVYNLISWAIEHRDQGVENLMAEVDHLFINMRS